MGTGRNSGCVYGGACEVLRGGLSVCTFISSRRLSRPVRWHRFLSVKQRGGNQSKEQRITCPLRGGTQTLLSDQVPHSQEAGEQTAGARAERADFQAPGLPPDGPRPRDARAAP